MPFNIEAEARDFSFTLLVSSGLDLLSHRERSQFSKLYISSLVLKAKFFWQELCWLFYYSLY